MKHTVITVLRQGDQKFKAIGSQLELQRPCFKNIFNPETNIKNSKVNDKRTRNHSNNKQAMEPGGGGVSLLSQDSGGKGK